MDHIRIRGGRPLSGEIVIGGAKNAALPLMAAGLLTDERLVLTNVPRLADITTMAALLAQHGIAVEPLRQRRPRAVARRRRSPTPRRRTTSCARCGRRSWCWGRCWPGCGEARVSLPGGCAIGARPVDLHLKGLEQMGAGSGWRAAISTPGRRAAARRDHRVPVRLGGGDREPADGGDAWPRAAPCWSMRRASRRSATWPHCLVAMGARIEGIGTDQLVIEGVAALHGARTRIIPDRIETGTYACAAAITGGSVFLRGARLEHLGAMVRVAARGRGGCGRDSRTGCWCGG